MEDTPAPSAEPRAKRQKIDKHGRFAALQRLKELKGSKHKCEINEVEDVYETVDEQEYVRRVTDRQDDDWIVNDDGSGYVEDGREIFDDDLDEESLAASSKEKYGKRKKKNLSKNPSSSANLQYMLSNMQPKKKESKIENEDVLTDLISEINEETSAGPSFTIKPKVASVLDQKLAAKTYMNSLIVGKENLVVNEVAPVVVEKNVESPSTEFNDLDINKIKFDDVSTPKRKKFQLDFSLKQEKLTQDSQLDPEVTRTKIVVLDNQVIKMSSETPKVEKISPKQDKTETLLSEAFKDDLDLSSVDIDMEENRAFPKVPDADWSIKPTVTPKDVKEVKNCELIGPVSDQEIKNLIDSFTFKGNETVKEILTDDSHGLIPNDKEFIFFWWNAHEDPHRRPGVVLLFGKYFDAGSKTYKNCCVIVKNILRQVFLLPRKYLFDQYNRPTETPVTMTDVYNEFKDKIAPQNLISTFKSRKVQKMFAFNTEVPLESEYLEVRFTGSLNSFNRKYKTISHVFGENNSYMDVLVLERKIKGPCWLKITQPVRQTNVCTYSAIECICDNSTNLSVVVPPQPIPPPPLVVMAINIKLATTKSGQGVQIAMISCITNERYCLDKQKPDKVFNKHLCVFTKPEGKSAPPNLFYYTTKLTNFNFQKAETERALLNIFMSKFEEINPDLIVGYDVDSYIASVLQSRLVLCGAKNGARLSKIRHADFKGNFKPGYKLQSDSKLFAGRMICDIKKSAMELIRARSYDLDSLCNDVLKIPENERTDIEPSMVAEMYGTSHDLLRMINMTMQDTLYILRIMFELNIIPLALQITNIAGSTMAKTLRGGRSDTNEALLMHAFYEKNYIVPDRVTDRKAKSKSSYAGGLVLDPVVGFHDKLVLLMDFNSLYPSIIQEYNICFTTINLADEELVLPDKSVSQGILPTEVKKLVESRREVKKLMAAAEIAPDLYLQYNIRQMALKLTANSLYGCLGYSNSRFFAKKLAALITQKGRDILTHTQDVVSKMNYEILYGDTDSIMINTNITDYDQVFKIGYAIKQEINKLYRHVELDIDGVFKYLLLLKKKKYAAVTLVKKNSELIEKREFKGLDVVRRDWSTLASDAGKYVLEHILSDQTPEQRSENIHNYLRKIREEVEANKVPKQLLIIIKQLNKDPAQYTNSNSLPHVQVALRQNSAGGKRYKAGDTVPYIICTDGTDNTPMQRAYLPSEMFKLKNLEVDTMYYLAQQVFPVVSRICEPIEGIDNYQVAESLGLEEEIVKKVAQKAKVVSVKEYKQKEILGNYVMKFRNVNPFVFKCPACKTENKLTDLTKDGQYSLAQCENKACKVAPYEYSTLLINTLSLSLRKYLKQYYRPRYICEDPTCPNTTKVIQQLFYRLHPVCNICQKGLLFQKYNGTDLYMQIMYFKRMFNVGESRLENTKMEKVYQALVSLIDELLEESAYCILNMSNLFALYLEPDPLEAHFPPRMNYKLPDEEEHMYDNAV